MPLKLDKVPSEPLSRAIVELARRNRSFGCPRIALIISKTFGIEIDKHVVRRVLAKHYRPESGVGGPLWLTFLGHMKDSLWIGLDGGRPTLYRG